ncbi:cysteine synthase A [Fusibacter bizertensis]|uniref:Cysteine synthase A n=1 Tax=Fusibacter bizertensis TaxID=1488331 RepID=A0ABT6NBV9_9FIRM|nr:cysteine synthase A [Fusibacter bizertensis]MDH8677889.1 cysteine synthase A [Fusibacter bizertensis]
MKKELDLKVSENILDLIGNTPVVKLSHIVSKDAADVYVKLEGMNLTGSVKARAALGMILEAEASGDLKEGMTIIEPTSGNTGIALAYIGKLKGYPVKIVMPDTMSVERRNIIKSYGAELMLTDGSRGMSGAIQEATRLSKEEKYFMPQQFNNQANRNFHYQTTGPEIIKAFPELDAFIASVGTGGTISGVGAKLKEHYTDIQIVAVEPVESHVLSGGQAGPHKIQGIGAGFVPEIYDATVVDSVEQIDSTQAYEMTKKLFLEEGLFLGISSGAAILAAIRVAEKLGKGKKVVVISPDNGEKYISNNVFL